MYASYFLNGITRSFAISTSSWVSKEISIVSHTVLKSTIKTFSHPVIQITNYLSYTLFYSYLLLICQCLIWNFGEMSFFVLLWSAHTKPRYRRTFEQFLSLQWKSMEFKTTLDPIDIHCMDWHGDIFQNIFFCVQQVIFVSKFLELLVTLYYRDQFSQLTSCLLACLLLTYWLFISTYKAHILHDHILHP